MDPEVIRRRAEQHAKVLSKRARAEQIAKEKQLIEAERERLAKQAIEQLGMELDNKMASIDLLRELHTIEEMKEASQNLFDFLIDNAETIKIHYLDKASEYITNIVMAISENPFAQYSVLDDSVVHAVSIKSNMDKATESLGMDQIDIQWMNTDNDHEVAKQLALEQFQSSSRYRFEDWMLGLSDSQIRRILG